MKRLLYILFLLVLNFTLKAQVAIPANQRYPIQQNLGADSTQVMSKGAISGRIIVYNFTDTTQANTQRIKYYPGALIFTTLDTSLWTRNTTATKWLRGSGAVDITSFNFLNDSTLIICFANGVCDTISMINFSTIVTNIVNNNTTTTINGDTLFICHADGSCDTLLFTGGGDIFNFYFLNDSTAVVCGDTSIVCQSDTCQIVQQCDTINIPPIKSLVLQSGLERTGNIGWFGNTTDASNPIGNPNTGPLSAWMQRPTTLNTFVFPLNVTGFPVGQEVTLFYQQQNWGISTDIVDFLSSGSRNAIDNQNRVKLHIGYFGNNYENGAIDSGYFLKDIGYAITTNLQGAQSWGVRVDNPISKWASIFFNTLDTTNTNVITFYGSRPPLTDFVNVPLQAPTTAPLYDKQIMGLKYDKTIRAYGYGAGAKLATPSTISGWDANGNFVEIDTADIGGSVTFIDSTKIIICSFGDFLCDTIFTTTGDGGYFTPNQTNITGTTTHNANFNNFIVNNINISEYTAGTNGNYSVIHQDSALISLYSLHNATATSSDLWVRPDSIRLLPFQGKLNIDTLQQGFSVDSVMVWNKTTGRVGFRNASSFGSVNAANNGLIDSSGTIQLGDVSAPGSKFYADRYINLQDKTFNITGASAATYNMAISGTGTAINLRVTSDATNTAISGIGGFVGVHGEATSGHAIEGVATTGEGVHGEATTGVGGNFLVNPSSTNTIVTVAKLSRFSSGTPADGIGGSLDYYIQTADLGALVSNQLESKWINSTAATRTSQLDITGVNSAATTTIMSAYGSGVVGIGISSGYTGTRLEVVDNSLAGSSMVKLTSTSTAATGNTQKMFEIALSGVNANANQSTYGAYISNAHNGGSGSTMYGIYTEATGGGGSGTTYGLYGKAPGAGVAGQTTAGGFGVFGSAITTAAGYGVYGQANVTSGKGVYGEGTLVGVWGFSNTTGVYAQSVNGIGLNAESGSSVPIQAHAPQSSTNSVLPMIEIYRQTSGTAVNGEGGSIDFYNESASGADQLTNKIVSYYRDATNASRTAMVSFLGTVNAATDTLMKMGDYVNLTESSATLFAQTTVATGKIAGGQIVVTIEANDATDFTSRTMRFTWVAVNKAGTTTITIGTPEEIVASSSGATLTATITAVDGGSGLVQFKANAVSSLTQTTLRCSYQMSKNF